MQLRDLKNQRGSTLALYAIMLTGLLGCMALAIDVGMGFDARSEAQRVADSSALAGASAFMDETGLAGETEAEVRAMAYATQNYVNDAMVEAGEVFIDPDWNQKTVEVIITRQAIPVWFARFLGVFDIDVQARAVAMVSEGGTATQCILPFSPPDIWDDNDADTVVANDLPDIGEDWNYEEPQDAYEPWDGTDNQYNGIGYGSNYRGGDVGMRLYLKAGSPGQQGKGDGGGAGGADEMIGPGNFLLWRMPDPNADCSIQAGAEHVQWNIENCNTCPINIGPDYQWESQPGNEASIQDELLALVGEDSGASWQEGCTSGLDCVVGSQFTDVRDSPRVRPVAFHDPRIHLQGHTEGIEFTNMAWVFVEGGGTDPPDFAVYARFAGRVAGGEEGPETGPLVQYLRLIE